MMLLARTLLLFLSSLLLLACDNKVQEKHLIVATSPDNPPYEFMQNGEVVGLDIDIINAIGKVLGTKVVIKSFDFNGLLAAIVSDNADLAIAGLGITDDRKEHVDFSDPYIILPGIAVLHRAADHFKDKSDLTNKRIGVQLGTTWATIAKKVATEVGGDIHPLSSNLILVEELKAGAIDAVIIEKTQAKKFAQMKPELKYYTLDEFVDEGASAIALPKNSQLTSKINEAIKILKKNGTIEKIVKKWMHS